MKKIETNATGLGTLVEISSHIISSSELLETCISQKQSLNVSLICILKMINLLLEFSNRVELL